MLTRPNPTAADSVANPYAALTPAEREAVLQELEGLQAKIRAMRTRLDAWLADARRNVEVA